jgi:hypothetical protein
VGSTSQGCVEASRVRRDAAVWWYACTTSAKIPKKSYTISLISKTNILNKIRPDCFEMGPIGCRETSVKSYDSTLRKTPRERRSEICCPLVR